MKNRTSCWHRGYPRTRAEKERFLREHFRYGGSYAVRIRIRDIRNKTKREEDALWHAIADPGNPAWGGFERNRKAFLAAQRGCGISIEGRSNGYAVLRIVNAKGQYIESVPIDEGVDYGELQYGYLDAMVSTVRAFDKAVEYAVRDFIAAAVRAKAYDDWHGGPEKEAR